MTREVIDIGAAPNDRTGDPLRVAFDKSNNNFAELYERDDALQLAIDLVSPDSPGVLLAKLLTVDGTGSGLNADLVQGRAGSSLGDLFSDASASVDGEVMLFAGTSGKHAKRASATGLALLTAGVLSVLTPPAGDLVGTTATQTLSGKTIAGASNTLTVRSADIVSLDYAKLTSVPSSFTPSAHTHPISDVVGLQPALDTKLAASAYTAGDVLTKIKTVDGSGSGLDADLLRGSAPAAFAAAVHTHVVADITDLAATLALYVPLTSAPAGAIVGTSDAQTLTNKTIDGANNTLTVRSADITSLDYSKLTSVPSTFAPSAHTHTQSEITGLTAALAAKLDSSSYTAADVLAKLLTVDGAGTGLDADTLDGISSAGFALVSHTHAIADVTGLTAALAAKLDSSSYTAADVLSKLLTVDGAGTGLDADVLDGISSAGYLQTSSYQALTPTWTQLHTFTANVRMESGNPRLIVMESGLSTDTGLWDFNFDGGAFEIRTRTDADGAGVNIFKVLRPSGSTTPTRLFCGNDVTADIAGLSTTAGNIGNYPWVFTNANNSTRACRLLIPSIATSAAGFNTLRYCGTFASPTQITNASLLGNYVLAGYNTDTATIREQSGFIARALQDWTSTAMGTALDLLSTANGTSTVSTTIRCHGTQAQFLDGNATLPAVAFQNSTGLGLYRIASNQMGIAANATLVLDIATSLFAITATTVRFNTTTASTVGAAGGASALPATPLGYLAANVGGTAVKIPYYNN